MIQYSAALVMERSFAAYWIPAFAGMTPARTIRERLRRAARLSEEADPARFRAALRRDRGDHRCGAAARSAPRLMGGNAAQPAGEDAATRGLSRRRLHRHKARRRQERAVQAGEVSDFVGCPSRST